MSGEQQQGRWMAVEVMGHRRHVGLVTEVTRFGGTFMHIEELHPDGSFVGLNYSHGAIFGFSDVTEDWARKAAMPQAWAPACDNFKQPSAWPGYCPECGHDEAAHNRAPALEVKLADRVLAHLRGRALAAPEISEALDISPDDADEALHLLLEQGKVQRRRHLWCTAPAFTEPTDPDDGEGDAQPDEPEDEATAAAGLRCGAEVGDTEWGCDLLKGHRLDVDHHAGGYGPPRLRHGANGWDRAWALIVQRRGAYGAGGEGWQYVSSSADGHVLTHSTLGREVIPIEPGDFYPKCSEGAGCGLAGCATCSKAPDLAMYERTAAAWAANDASAP